jgi:hypothetical protein
MLYQASCANDLATRAVIDIPERVDSQVTSSNFFASPCRNRRAPVFSLRHEVTSKRQKKFVNRRAEARDAICRYDLVCRR